MEELIKELREYAKHAQWQAPGKAADALEAQQAEISSFCMNYRMKCDEETKSLHIQIEAQQARIAELDSALDACLSGKRIPVAVTNRTDDLSALAAHDAEITSKYIHLLSDQNYEYNQKTNALIKRHVEQLVKVRKAALLEVAEWFKPKHTYEEMNVGLVQEKLRHMAEGEK